MDIYIITMQAAGVSITRQLVLESPIRHQQGHCLLPL